MAAFVLKDSFIVLYFFSKSEMFGGIISGLSLFLISIFFSSSVLFKSKSVKIIVLIPSKSNRLINWWTCEPSIL